MNHQSAANKAAWNYRSYEFWNQANGSPRDYARELLQNPRAAFNSRYVDLLVDLKGKRILNLLGSNGRKAVPLCLLGAEVTIIDISEENRRYAQELARYAGVHLNYEVADFATYSNETYHQYFDIIFAEGGILHYFSDLSAFFRRAADYLKASGRLILNDFHPYRKIMSPGIGTNGDYFDSDLHEGPVAYEDQFAESDRKAFPKCVLRYFTIGEIISRIGANGLWIQEMRELRGEKNPCIPTEFTIIAQRL